MIALQHIRRAAALAYAHNIRGSRGYFAIVTPHSPGYVKKISPGDWAYKLFAEAVYSGELPGPHVPKIRRLHTDGTGCLVVMEELHPVQDLPEYDNYLFRDALCALVEAYDTIEDPFNDEEVEGFLQHILTPEYIECFDSLELVRLAYDIGELCEQYGMHFDLHARNIMYRKSDGALVITDPVCDMDEGIPLEHFSGGTRSTYGWRRESGYDTAYEDSSDQDGC